MASFLQFLMNQKNRIHIGCGQQRYKDSNLEMTESESVALPFGDSAMSPQQDRLYISHQKNASTFFIFFKFFYSTEMKRLFPL